MTRQISARPRPTRAAQLPREGVPFRHADDHTLEAREDRHGIVAQRHAITDTGGKSNNILRFLFTCANKQADLW